MKNFILPIALGITLFATSCADDKGKVKDNFIAKCKAEAYKGATTDDQKALFDEYCACAGDKVTDKFTASEIADMEKPEKQAELQAKMMPVIQPCLDDLTQKMISTMQMEAPAVDTTGMDMQ